MSRAPLPEPYRNICVAIPHRLLAKIDHARHEMRMSRSEFIRASLDKDANNILERMAQIGRVMEAIEEASA